MCSLDEAMIFFTSTITAKPSDSFAFTARSVVRLDKGELDLAITDSDQAIKLDPKNAQAFFIRAVALAARRLRPRDRRPQ